MSWFEDQLKQRQKLDNEKFSDSMDSIAGAVMGKRLSEALNSKEIAESAIEEILRYFNYSMKKEELPYKIESVKEQIDYHMNQFGIMTRSVNLESGWYRYAAGAMLGTLKEDGSVVVLIPGNFSGYSFLNLKTGKRLKLNRITEKMIDKEAFCFYKPLPLKSITIKDLLRFMVEQLSISDFVLYVGMMAVITGIGLFSPLFTKWLFGNVLESGSTTVLLALAGFMICYSVCRLLFSTFNTFVLFRIEIKQKIAVQAAVMSRVMSLPTTFFKNYSSGELNQRASYVQNLCSTLMNSIGTVGLTSLFSLVYIGQIFVFAPSLVLPSLVISLAIILIGLISTFLQMKITRDKMLVSSKNSGIIFSTITGIQKIKLAGAEKRMFARWAKNYSEEIRLGYNPPTFIKLSGTICLTISLLGTLFLYCISVKNGVSVADYYAFNSAYGMVSGALASFASIAATIATIKPIIEMAKPIMEAEPEISEEKERINQIRGSIEISNLCFRYDESMPYVIDNLSLKIRAGEYAAIVGSTGCGKSTLIRLLLGFEKPQKGTIFYDSHDIAKIDIKSLRRKIGTVMQDGNLFLGDIYSNISISEPNLTLEEVWKAAEIACVADDIRDMPMGMHTIISEGQGGISGGQKQRLMIARAVAPKPKILMFDEATSALDNITQKKISEAIDGLKCTRIVIAHRLSTIKHAQRILFLHEGRIVEDGTYEELVALNGYFAGLVERQRLDIE